MKKTLATLLVGAMVVGYFFQQREVVTVPVPEQPPVQVGATAEQLLATEAPLFSHIRKDGTVDAVITITQETLDIEGGWYVDKVFRPKSEWVRTSSKGTIRKNYGVIGSKYDKTNDAFVGEKPSIDATLDTTTMRWSVPIVQENTTLIATST